MAAAQLWLALPAEMKLSVVDLLDFQDVKVLATVNREAYSLCVSTMFKHVKIPDYESLRTYLSTVPISHNQYIQHLSICTKPSAHHAADAPSANRRTVTDAVLELVSHCPQVEDLTLSLHGSLSKSIIPCFTKLGSLTKLSINHCGDESLNPLSERLVVAIAASIPKLTQLSLDRITRSAIHAPELIGVYPFIPLVAGDEDIPPHALLDSELRLPSLLRLPTLKKLRIRDTHLGDPQWTCTPVACSLEVLDLGSCYHESIDFNRICTERIMGNVGHTVDEFALNTALSPQTFEYAKHKEPPLKRLRKVHLTPLFPVENVVDTLTTLSGSPIEQLSVQCHEDDVLDMCSALEDFLRLRAERGEQALYQHLTEITVKTVSDLADGLFGPFSKEQSSSTGELLVEHAEAVRHLQAFLRDLRRPRDEGDASEGQFPASSQVSGSDIEKSPAIAVAGEIDHDTGRLMAERLITPVSKAD
ncbi:uncharacterized protein LAESUDRAFT_654967 [Laetiporus sulphureus 93-53]|uniref:F-box domain-containing protein n=1 Tax=Laetiporus sulphureus 93-53 TaxID=1314785 RepID=A0A165DYU6_9APHY|nr:uncharacterized protein LAESUDRAFT_654967 [Laetiporus sulphureus 93-53]KZT05910.1 hypothetical protein LAESUDRAFT_654967 [Laetiporus sulphureus 93-53]